MNRTGERDQRYGTAAASASASAINHKSLFYEYSELPAKNNVGCGRSIGISFLPSSLCRRFKLALCKFTRVQYPYNTSRLRIHPSATNVCTRMIFNGCERERMNNDAGLSLSLFYPSFLWRSPGHVKKIRRKMVGNNLFSRDPQRTAAKNSVRYIRRKSENFSRFFLEFTRYARE